MAKPEHGILGAFSGKIGPVVGVNNKGTFYMRSAPRKRTYFSDKELINQAKFKIVQDYLRPIKAILSVGFKNYYTKTGGARAAFAYTRKHCLEANDTGFYINPTLFKISGGTLSPAIEPAVSLVRDNTLQISWSTAPHDDNTNHADQLMILLYHSESQLEHSIIFNGPFREQGTYDLPIPDYLKDKPVDVHIGFIAADRSRQSDSQYLGRILPLFL